MKSYETYNNIDLPWLDAIPGHWNLVGLNLLFADNKVKNEGMFENNILSLSYGNIVKRKGEENFGLIPASYETYQVINPGYIVLRLTDMQNDHTSLRVGLVKERGIITSAYTGLIPKQNVNSTYFYYLLHTLDLVKYIYVLGGGVRQSSDYNEIKKLKLPFPPVEEQTAIANYLDAQKEKINLFIIQKQKLIVLLKEQKQAIINRAVTKGIDEKVKLKPSGIDWIKAVPENWEVKKLKFVAKINYGQSPNEETYNDLGKGAILINGPVEYSESDFGYTVATKWTTDPKKFASKGDILFCLRGSTTGRLNICHDDVAIGRGVASIRPKEIDYEFFVFAMQNLRTLISFTFQGSTFPSVTSGDLNNYYMSYPTALEEQKKVAEFIKAEAENIDEVIIKTEKEIQLIKEYRQSIVAEVVTGKIKVA